MDQQLVTERRSSMPAPHPRRASLLWIAGALLLAYSAAIAFSGGINATVAGVRFRSRTWERPAVIGLACVAFVAIADRRRALVASRRVLASAGRALDASWIVFSPGVVTIAAAGWTLAAGLLFGTAVAGGADSSGYLNQARLFAAGRLLDGSRLRDGAGLPEPSHLAPLGYRPAADRERLAPTYPPGYPLLMAPWFHVDERLAFVVVPVCGAALVWLTFAIARRVGEPGAGAAAALLLSVSPTFLYQLVQPMSDVPAAAAWVLAVWLAMTPRLATAAAAGVAAGLAILVRPNLAPLAAIVWALSATGDRAGRLGRGAVALAATAPALFALASIQALRYGSPVASGYGRTRDLFAWENVLPNLDRYPRWMFETHTPAIMLFLVAPLWIYRLRAETRRVFLLLWLFTIAVVAAYLPYVYFQSWEWSYTRFLLPALPFMWLLTVTPFARLLRNRRPALAALIAVPALAALAGFSVITADRRFAFDLRDGERKYVRAADYVKRTLPPNAIIVSMQHSGSLWFYTAYPVLRWDLIEPRRFDDTIAWAFAQGYAVYMVADVEELERMRERFGPARQRALDDLSQLAQFGETAVAAFRRPAAPPAVRGSGS